MHALKGRPHMRRANPILPAGTLHILKVAVLPTPMKTLCYLYSYGILILIFHHHRWQRCVTTWAWP